MGRLNTIRYDTPMDWNLPHLVEVIAEAFRRQAKRDDEEQAVYGFDARDELSLHPMIQQALRDAGYGVWPEQRYPADRTPRRRKSEGKRCDIVLTPDARPIMDPEAQATLFSNDNDVPLESSYWMEVKTVAQFTTEGPFANYSKELLSPVRQDIRKLASDPLIFHAGLLLVLFTADEITAVHDLKLWEHRALDRGYPVASPITRHFPITDRLGNAHATIALFRVRRL